MVAYEEFIEKLKLFLNNSNKLLFNEKARHDYTNEQAEKILHKKIKNFDSNKILEDNYVDIIKVLIYEYMVTDRMFCPYRSYDYSFLDIYSDNVKKVMIEQIELDSNGNTSIKEYNKLFNSIDNIDDLLTLSEIYVNPPVQLKLLNK